MTDEEIIILGNIAIDEYHKNRLAIEKENERLKQLNKQGAEHWDNGREEYND